LHGKYGWQGKTILPLVGCIENMYSSDRNQLSTRKLSLQTIVPLHRLGFFLQFLPNTLLTSLSGEHPDSAAENSQKLRSFGMNIKKKLHWQVKFF
jgi:hypothetical protein